MVTKCNIDHLNWIRSARFSISGMPQDIVERERTHVYSIVFVFGLLVLLFSKNIYAFVSVFVLFCQFFWPRLNILIFSANFRPKIFLWVFLDCNIWHFWFRCSPRRKIFRVSGKQYSMFALGSVIKCSVSISNLYPDQKRFETIKHMHVFKSVTMMYFE